jgi:hypothetical protein
MVRAPSPTRDTRGHRLAARVGGGT